MAAISIEKLDSSNYRNWCNDMKYILLDKNLWYIIEDNLVKPAKEKPTDEEIEAFKAKSNQALSIIYLNISVEFKRLIENCKNPVEAWNKLKLNYCPDSRSHHMKIFTDLMECKIKTNETINLFAARLARITRDIKQIDDGFNECYANFQLLRFLPRKFDAIVQNILRWGKSDFQFSKIVEELVAEETRLNVRDSDSGKCNLQANQLNFRRKQENFKGFKKRKCWKCGQSGHLQKNCLNRSNNVNKYEQSGFSRSRLSSPFYRRNTSNGNSFRGNSPSRYARSTSSQATSPSYHARVPDYGRVSPSSSRCQSRSRQPEEGTYSPGRNMSRNRPRYRRNNQRWNESPGHSESPVNFCKSSNIFISNVNVNCINVEARWILDTGATHHFTNDKSIFINFSPLIDQEMTVAVKDISFPIEGRGDVKLLFGKRHVLLKNVMYSSKLRRSLISGPQLDKNGATFIGGKGKVTVSREGHFLFNAYLKSGVYQVFPRIPKSLKIETNSLLKSSEMETWHRRFGHISPAILVHTCKEEGVRGMPKLKDLNFKCEKCKISKHKKVSFKAIGQRRSQYPLELLFADVWGPCQVQGRNGEKYFLTIIDDYSRRVSIYPIRMKSDSYEIVRNHITRAETFMGRKVKNVRTDNGGEFVNDDLDEFFKSKGIMHELTNPYTPQQNGTAERFMQTVINGARTLLSESNLDLSFWPEAVKFFVYTWNRVCPKTSSKTPFELYGGNKPSVKHLKPFGSVAFVGIPRQKREGKLGPRAKRGILVGYAFKTKGYRIWIPETDSIIESIDVTFDEKSRFDPDSSGAVMGPEEVDLFPDSLVSNQNDTVVEVEPEVIPGPSNEVNDPQASGEGESDSESIDSSSPAIPSLRDVSWTRKAVPRPTGKRVDVYYYETGKTDRLRSIMDVERYCDRNQIKYNPDIFDFKGNNLYSGPVSSVNNSDEDEDSDAPESNQVNPES